MAEPKNVKPQITGIKFDPVQTTIQIGSTHRGEAGGTLSQSGRLVLNVEGTDLWMNFVKSAGLNPLQSHATYGANEENGLAAAYAVSGTTPKAMAIRLNEKEAVLHLGGVFKDYPNLRPAGKVEVALIPGVDHEGKACLIIPVKAGLPKQTNRRRSSTRSQQSKPESQPEAKLEPKPETKPAIQPEQPKPATETA